MSGSKGIFSSDHHTSTALSASLQHSITPLTNRAQPQDETGMLFSRGFLVYQTRGAGS
jgi:hypothetical protein